MRVADAIDVYIAHISAIMSDNTVKCKDTTLKKVKDEIGDLDIELLTPADVSRTCTVLCIGHTRGTQRTYLAGFRSFLAFSKLMGYCSDLTMCIQRPRLPRALPRLPPEGAVSKILSYVPQDVGNDRNAFSRIRARTVVCMLPLTGLRVGELIDLDVDSITLNGSPEVFVRGKGDRERVVPIPGRLADILDEYIYRRKRYHSEYYGAFFASWAGEQWRRMSPQGIRQNVRSFLKVCGIPYFNPHRFRHYYATMLLRNGVDIYTIKELMGHSSLASTQVYLSTNMEAKRAAVEGLASVA